MRSSYFEVKDLDSFVADLEPYVSIVLSAKGMYLEPLSERNDSWPEYCTAEDGTISDVSLEHMIFLHISEGSLCLLPCGMAGAQAQSDYIAITSESIYEIKCPISHPQSVISEQPLSPLPSANGLTTAQDVPSSEAA